MNIKIHYFLAYTFILTTIIGGFVFLTPQIHANQALENAQAEEARLRSELSALENEIAEKQKELEGQKGQSVSLSRDIAILTTQIKKSKLDIQAKNLVIKKLGGEITQKNQKIKTLSTKIETEKESLAQLIRKDREIDERSIIALILSKDSISDVYGDIENFASLKEAIKESVDEIRGVKSETETEKKSLEKKQDEQVDARVALESEKKKVETTEGQKQQLLSISKNKETEYQKVLAEKARRRTAILNALFALRDTGSIPFGKALEFAKTAEEKTGIRPAFLLAILTQESNLGRDQGSCYVTNSETGAGVSSRSGRTIANVMKPNRDIKPFNEITLALGRDPAKTLVSCPIAGSGYGGAMGPAQFIPSTWVMLKNRIATALGIKTPDPWYPRDAFMASAMYLTDLGADDKTYTAERNAACRYYSGRKCDTKKPTNYTYGDSVMKKAANIQEKMIDPLQN